MKREKNFYKKYGKDQSKWTQDIHEKYEDMIFTTSGLEEEFSKLG